MMRAAFLGLAVLAACGDQPAHGVVGSRAPDYAAVSMSGDSVSLAQLQGDVVLLNVWATWCIPCRVEIPELQALHQTFGSKGLRVVGVSVDAGGADDMVADFAKQFGISYIILRDPAERITTLYATPGVPASFLIDRKGVVRWRHLGPFRADNPVFRRALDAAL